MASEVKDKLVLINGWGANKNIWHRLIKDLEDRFEIVYIDLHEERFAIDKLCPEFFSDAEKHIDSDSFSEISNNKSNVEHYTSVLIETLAKEIPKSAHLLGWSLGGMLAIRLLTYFTENLACQNTFPIKSLVTLASNVSFVKGSHWPWAMDEKIFKGFFESFLHYPKKAVLRFLGLQVQGLSNSKKSNSKESILELKEFNVFLSDNNDEKSKSEIVDDVCLHLRGVALLKVLFYLNGSKDLEKISIPCKILFFGEDSLVPVKASESISINLFKLEHSKVSVDVIPDACHAAMLFNTDKLLESLYTFYDAEDIAPLKKMSALHLDQPCNDLFYRDKNKIARSFSAAALSYDSVAGLQREVADKLIKMQGSYEGLWADLGCGTGYCIEKLKEKYVQTTFLGLDLAYGMLHVAKGKKQCNEKTKKTMFCVGDLDSLPIASDTVDGLISSLSIQWVDDLSLLFKEAYRTLKPGGMFLCSSLVPGTLKELKQAWQDADPKQVHVNEFKTPLNHIDSAEQQGFELIQFAQEPKVLQYQKPMELMRELKALGAHNMNAGNRQGLTGKQTLRKVHLAYEHFRVNEEGKNNVSSFLPATYQVIYLALKKPV